MTCLVLAHGWGLRADFWDGLRACLPGLPTLALALEDFGPGVLPPLPAEGPVVAVGHSLGFLWLVHRRPLRWAGLVSINGFARFTRADDLPQGVPGRMLERMRARFAQAPEAVHADFLRRCGLARPDLRGLAPAALAEGLRALAEWDARGALGGPLLALAGRADPIVPAALSEATFAGHPLAWHEEGGHLLPLTHPEWCAAHVRRFVEALA